MHTIIVFDKSTTLVRLLRQAFASNTIILKVETKEELLVILLSGQKLNAVIVAIQSIQDGLTFDSDLKKLAKSNCELLFFQENGGNTQKFNNLHKFLNSKTLLPAISNLLLASLKKGLTNSVKG